MAQTTECKACKKEVAIRADKCPHCGVSNPGVTAKEMAMGVGVLAAVVLVLFAILSGGDPSPPKQAEQPAGPPAEWLELDRSEEMQDRRVALIQQLHTAGIISRIEKPATLPYIYVGPGWYELEADDQLNFVNGVLTYYYAENPKATTAFLRDRRTGKDIGGYTFRTGLILN